MRVSVHIYTENQSNKNNIFETHQMETNVNGTFGNVSSIYFAQ